VVILDIKRKRTGDGQIVVDYVNRREQALMFFDTY